MKTTVRLGSRQSCFGMRHGLKRYISWRDFNPLPYIYSGFATAKSYVYGSSPAADSQDGQGGQNSQGGQGDGATSIELSTVADPVPVFLDLSSVKNEEEEEETLVKIQNLGKFSLLIFIRFRKYFFRVLAKYMKVLFEDHYEYLFLILMFFML